MRDWNPNNVHSISQEPSSVEPRAGSRRGSVSETTESSCEPLYEEIARLLDHASVTLEMATGMLGEMAKGFSEEAKTLRNLGA